MKIKFYLNLILTLIIIFLLWRFLQPINKGEVIAQAQQAEVKTWGSFFALETKSYVNNEFFATNSATLMNQINAQSALALDLKTKQILFSKNANVLLYPASTTKIMTALVARDLFQLTQQFTIQPQDLIYGNVVGWKVGEEVTCQTLLQALLIASANEAGLILAHNAPGGYNQFVQLMNQKALSLGLGQSQFYNPQGFDHQQQKTTAQDLAWASLELLRDQDLAKMVATDKITLTTLNGQQYQVKNTNRLFELDLPFKILGVKTGTTSLAHEALVTLIEKNEKQILLVVLSTKNRYNDTISLINFIFDNYIWHKQKNIL